MKSTSTKMNETASRQTTIYDEIVCLGDLDYDGATAIAMRQFAAA